jgi:hypothetical protein
MYRLSPELASELMKKIKVPEIESSGPNAFLPKNLNSIGIIDSMVAIGVDYYYSIECPGNVIYPELPPAQLVLMVTFYIDEKNFKKWMTPGKYSEYLLIQYAQAQMNELMHEKRLFNCQMT